MTAVRARATLANGTALLLAASAFGCRPRPVSVAGSGAAPAASPFSSPAASRVPPPQESLQTGESTSARRRSIVGAGYLPNPALTPGDTLDVSASDICVPGYSGKVRDVPAAVKRQAYAAYNITRHRPGQYEVDHLISLELGGSNSIRNLWPESYEGTWNAHVKDRLENELHRRICAGRLDMATAQREIATDWVAAYKKYLGDTPGPSNGATQKRRRRANRSRSDHGE